MTTFKDMTFCSFYTECKKGKDCFRALTNAIKFRAKVVGLPISQFVSEPDCFEEKEEEWNRQKGKWW